MEALLRLYTDSSWRIRGLAHAPLLYPFWGNTFSDSQPLTKAVFDAYPFDTKEYTIVDDIRSADAILLPYRYEVALTRGAVLQKAVALSESAQIPLVIDATGDTDYVITIPRSIVLKWGGYRFSKCDNEIIIPPYADDLLERYNDGKPSERAKADVPVIGFAGRASQSFLQELRGTVKTLPNTMRGFLAGYVGAFTRGITIRRRALRFLRKSNCIQLNALVRDSYSGNIITATGDPETLRREFVENALASDLGLDVRGDANASTRLFELLSLGRVPLIIDTERNFPFSDELDYRSFSIIVDFRNIHDLARIAREAYDRLSPEEWRTMQERARAAYREWFRPDAMTKHLMKRIRARL